MKFDYRIISFERINNLYNKFLLDRKKTEHKNEFEPFLESIEKFFDEIGFVAKTLFIFFFPYLTIEKFRNYNKSNLSLHALSIDYHIIVKKILGDFIKNDEKLLNSKTYIQSDNGLLNERFFAINTGLCIEGTNGLAIHKQYGSYGFLGIIATDEVFDEKITSIGKCRGCDICVKMCPASAIEEGKINNRCISYLTQKKELSIEEENILRNSSKIYGCDICQIVCPENKEINYSKIKDFEDDILYNIYLEDIISKTNKEFRKEFGNRNFSWRGKKVLIRNLMINEQRNKNNK